MGERAGGRRRDHRRRAPDGRRRDGVDRRRRRDDGRTTRLGGGGRGPDGPVPDGAGRRAGSGAAEPAAGARRLRRAGGGDDVPRPPPPADARRRRPRRRHVEPVDPRLGLAHPAEGLGNAVAGPALPAGAAHARLQRGDDPAGARLRGRAGRRPLRRHRLRPHVAPRLDRIPVLGLAALPALDDVERGGRGSAPSPGRSRPSAWRSSTTSSSSPVASSRS